MCEDFVKEFQEIISHLDESQLKVEKHAFDVINSSDTSLNLVKEGITNIEGIVEDVLELNNIVEESATEIQQLEVLAQSIQDFASTVGQLANKTNTLSRNAAIEAAKAGKAGEGFALVVSEVGVLAEQSSDSSNDISETVQLVNHYVESMIDTMNRIYAKSVEQQEKAMSIGKLLDQLLKAALVANDKSRGMENEIAYQRDITDEVREIMDIYCKSKEV